MKVHFTNLPNKLAFPLNEVLPYLKFQLGDDGFPIEVVMNHVGPKLIIEDEKAILEYHKIPEFFRLLTMLPNKLKTTGIYEETPAHEDLCLMAECSRNAVFNLPSAKRMIRYLALMGFTSMMLYTEDTYEIPEYPLFGYLRGRFSQKELKEIDSYAAKFGIEVIPCIQVLAHLEGALKWNSFNEITDINNILLVGEEKTYHLIDCMLKSCRECFRSDRINLGMDEAFILGAGKYQIKNGPRARHDIMLDHMKRVVDLCNKYQYHPMMWSDMFFRATFGEYRISEGEIPKEVIAEVPDELTLVYWNYYTLPDDEKTFRHMIHCHKQFDNPYYFAGGAWKWDSNAPRNYFSLYVNDLHLKICKEEKVPMVIATAWGDNGGEVSNFAILPTLQQYAEYCYANGNNRDWIKQRFGETYDVSFDEFLLLDSLNQYSDFDTLVRNVPTSKAMLYNDPLGGWFDCHISPYYGAEYAEKAQKLAAIESKQFGYLFKTAALLAKTLSTKATLSSDTRDAYHKNDRSTLCAIASERIPATLSSLEEYLQAARDEWYYDNKTFGFDIVELRIGGLKERLKTAKRTIEQYLAGERETIEQLEQELLDLPDLFGSWVKFSSACINY